MSARFSQSNRAKKVTTLSVGACQLEASPMSQGGLFASCTRNMYPQRTLDSVASLQSGTIIETQDGRTEPRLDSEDRSLATVVSPEIRAVQSALVPWHTWRPRRRKLEGYCTCTYHLESLNPDVLVALMLRIRSRSKSFLKLRSTAELIPLGTVG